MLCQGNRPEVGQEEAAAEPLGQRIKTCSHRFTLSGWETIISILTHCCADIQSRKVLLVRTAHGGRHAYDLDGRSMLGMEYHGDGQLKCWASLGIIQHVHLIHHYTA